MAEDKRQELLRRAKLLQRAKEIQSGDEPVTPVDEMTDDPNEAEYRRLIEMSQSRKLDPREAQMLEAIKTSHAMDVAGKTAIRAIGTGLDYPAGLTRTALADIYDQPLRAMNPSRKPLVTQEDWDKAKKGQAPLSSEYMIRAGAPEGLATEIAGGVADLGTDPLMAVNEFAKPIAKLASKAPIIGEFSEKSIPYLGAEKGFFSGKLRNAGKNLYKSGLTPLDIEVAKYGKEPVSDLLLREGVTGSMEQIQKKMDDLAELYLTERNAILAEADRAGGYASMNDAMAPLQERINQIRANKDPALQKAADAMQKDLNRYKRLDQPGYTEITSVPAQQKFVELPRQQKMVAGEHRQIYFDPETQTLHELPVSADATGAHRELKGLPIAKVEMGQVVPEKYKKRPGQMTYSEEKLKVSRGKTVPAQYENQLPDVGAYNEPAKVIPGKTKPTSYATPSQASAYKSSIYGNIPSKKYAEIADTPIGQELEKIKARGLKEETERATGRALGDPSEKQIKELNDKLGRLLSSQERAELEAAKEARKKARGPSQVSAMVAAVEPKSWLAKKAAEIAQGTEFKTKAGKRMMDLADTEYFEPTARNILYSPWPTVHRQTRKEK